jgi:hypothetical protein
MGGDVSGSAANVVMLCKGYKGKHETYYEQSNKFLHVFSFSERPEDCSAGWWVRAIERAAVSGQFY